jgi:hypothetical protein
MRFIKTRNGTVREITELAIYMYEKGHIVDWGIADIDVFNNVVRWWIKEA